ncbi:hypothetical protein DENSPDRAFT_828692 [Dentipellis sp. KUC8613]|nr:hypothetical protein DENSPDRAFT_828692 [Dentipellis sp. KUC8613]
MKEFKLLQTYKYHSLADYPSMIRQNGTSDGYSTQRGELEHRRVKRFYGRTNKNQATKQITQLERREAILSRMDIPLASARKQQQYITSRAAAQENCIPDTEEPSFVSRPDRFYEIGQTQNFPLHLPTWLPQHGEDPATKDFLSRVREHLLRRILGLHEDDDRVFTDAERCRVVLQHDRLYRHKVFSVNYTTYDIRRDRDTFNLRTHRDLMILADEEDEGGVVLHPFAYARVLGIFHANVLYHDSATSVIKPRRMELLWVRWFRRIRPSRSAKQRNARRLHQLQLLPDDDDEAFGFLDPADVVRGVHLIPAFARGRQEDVVTGEGEDVRIIENDEWSIYYVNHFVDRDMYMRFCGRGIGHLTTAAVPTFIPADEVQEEDTTESMGAITRNAERDGAGDGTGHDDKVNNEADGEDSEEDDITDDDEDGEDWVDDDGLEGFAAL